LSDVVRHHGQTPMQDVKKSDGETYDHAYFADWLEEAERSAPVVVPLLLDFFPFVRSVVDIGCGPGAWLAEFRARGVDEIVGLDGSDIPPDLLQVAESAIRRADFRQDFAIADRYDLAMSLEVADCLPPAASEHFVGELTRTSDVVVFSAAAPGQSKRSGSNERWLSYWVSLFLEQGFLHVDLLRPLIWYDQRVSWRYAQNMMIFVRNSRDDLLEGLRSRARSANGPIDILHPYSYRRHTARLPEYVEEAHFYPVSLVEEGYLGFNILEIGSNAFLALRQSEGPYYPEKLHSGGYQHAYQGDSITLVKLLAAASVQEPVLTSRGYRGHDIYQLETGQFIAVPEGTGFHALDALVGGKLERAYFGDSIETVRRRIRRNHGFFLGRLLG
jgi:SAM-dependent methyltransferase